MTTVNKASSLEPSVGELLARREKLLGKNTPLFYDSPLHLVRGEGVHLYDAEGNQYLDVYNNVPNVGHCHPKVVAALTNQASTLNIHTRYLHELILDYAENLTSSMSPPLSSVMYTCTGSEANDLALRIARQATGSMGIICTDETYHGNTTAVDELATLFNDGQSRGAHVQSVPFPDTYRPSVTGSIEDCCAHYLASIDAAIDDFEKRGIGLAGVVVCPIFANEGVPVPPPGYLQGVADRVRQRGGIVIFDEVQSGFGRTGKMWGYQYAGVVPDIVTMGKPMGNGHPVAGVVTSSELVDRFREEVMYFNTFGGNPVSCAVAQAVLNVIEEEQLVANAKEVGAYLQQGLRKLQDQYEILGDIRGPGLFIGAELVCDRESKRPASEAAAKIVNMMKDRRVLISKIGRFDNILKIRPPIVFSKQNSDQLLDVLDDVLSHIEREGHA
jgi:4-aminobutyrate aminotransferase-like enzyme